MIRGDVAIDRDIDHTTGVARLLGRQRRLGDRNVVLVDRVDTTATTVRTLRVDPLVLEARMRRFASSKETPP